MSVSGTGPRDPNLNQGAPTVTLTPDEAETVKKALEENPGILDGKVDGVWATKPDKEKKPKQQKKSTILLQRSPVHREYVKIPKGVKNKKEYLNKIAKQETVRLNRRVQVLEEKGRAEEGGAGSALGNLSAQQFSDYLGVLNSPGPVKDLYDKATNPQEILPDSPILNNPTWYNGGTNPYIPPPSDFNPNDAGEGSVRVYDVDAQKKLVEELTKPINEGGAGLSPWGAAGLAGRMMGVEAPDGPDDSNDIGGGHYGIGQWGTSRARALGWIGKGETVNSALRNGTLKVPFNEQIKAVVNELNFGEEAAARKLRDATTIQEGVQGAAAFERAGGWNGVTDAGSSGTYGPAQRIYNNAIKGGWRGFGVTVNTTP